MDNELYEIAYALKGYGEKSGWNIVKAEKTGDQWSLVLEKPQQKVVPNENTREA